MGMKFVQDGNLHIVQELETAFAPHHGGMLISDVVHLSGTYLILLIRIRLQIRIYLIYVSIVLTVQDILIVLLHQDILLFFPYCSLQGHSFCSQWTIVLYHNRRSRLSLQNILQSTITTNSVMPSCAQTTVRYSSIFPRYYV